MKAHIACYAIALTALIVSALCVHDATCAQKQATDLENEVAVLKSDIHGMRTHPDRDIIIEDWRGRPGLPSRHRLPALGGMRVIR